MRTAIYEWPQSTTAPTAPAPFGTPFGQDKKKGSPGSTKKKDGVKELLVPRVLPRDVSWLLHTAVAAPAAAAA